MLTQIDETNDIDSSLKLALLEFCMYGMGIWPSVIVNDVKEALPERKITTSPHNVISINANQIYCIPHSVAFQLVSTCMNTGNAVMVSCQPTVDWTYGGVDRLCKIMTRHSQLLEFVDDSRMKTVKFPATSFDRMLNLLATSHPSDFRSFLKRNKSDSIDRHLRLRANDCGAGKLLKALNELKYHSGRFMTSNELSSSRLFFMSSKGEVLERERAWFDDEGKCICKWSDVGLERDRSGFYPLLISVVMMQIVLP